ncbi:DMT family transporter [Terrihabitans sp. B22-R8]|uniref:DMT family transporter n=1 Tax=Terrihabitans sp. B22-R8 TaxID=3425128 RepID=UPI00403C2DD2
MPLQAQLAALFVALAWGGNVVAAKLGVAEVPPFLLMTLRFILVGACLLPFCRFHRRELPWLLLISVTLGTGHFGLLFVAFQMAEAGTGALLVQLGAPMATLIAVTFLGEPLGWKRAAGLLFAVAGLLILVAGPTIPPPLPFALLLMSAACWAAANVIIRVAPPIKPIHINGLTALLCVPQVALLSLLLEGNPVPHLEAINMTGVAAILYTAIVSSIIAYGTWYRLIQTYSLSNVVMYSLLTPVFAGILGVVLLGDSLSVYKLFGGLAIVGGVALLALAGRTPPIETGTIGAGEAVSADLVEAEAEAEEAGHKRPSSASTI